MASSPSAPTNIQATPSNSSAFVTWTPSINNGSTIYGYKVTATPDSNFPNGYFVEVLGPNANAATVDNLLNNVSYQFTVTAINSIGSSPASVLSNSVIPYTIPNSPTNIQAVAGNGTAVINWTDPTYNGGSIIYGYTVTSNPDGRIATIIGPTSTSVSIYGLTNGTSYTFSVVATNAAGNSIPTTTTTSVTPVTVPTSPTRVQAFPGNRETTVTWNPPTFSGGTPILSYTVTTYPVSNISNYTNITVDAVSTSVIIRGLDINSQYYFIVTARNIVGKSTNSQPSSIITTFAVPQPPTNITASPGVMSSHVSWTAPTNVPNVNEYDVYIWQNNQASATNTNVTFQNGFVDISTNVYNLLPDTSYSFVVIAKNDSGPSSYSLPSNIITTFNIPSAPINVTADPSNQSALVRWTDISNGGSPITNYIINAIPITGSLTVAANSKTNPAYITGLSINTSYLFTVIPVNAVGIADTSGCSTNYVQTYSYPNPPTNLLGDSSNNNVKISWTPPINTGGTYITAYYIISNNGTIQTSINSISLNPYISPNLNATIYNLNNGQPYTFNVYSVNSVGKSQSYSSITVVPATNPNPSYNIYADPSNQSALVYWTDGFNGGSQILGYAITSIPVSFDTSGDVIYNTTKSIITTNITTNPGYVTGLNIDASYAFTVRPRNVFGYSLLDSNYSEPIQTFTYPGIPTNIAAFAGARSIKLLWSPPIDNGGAPVIGYKLNVYLGSNYSLFTTLIVGNVNKYTITGLTNNTNYIITMNTITVVGNSIESFPTPSIITYNYPNPPTQITGTPGDFQVFLNWAELYNGGTNIIRYDISVNSQIYGNTITFDTSVNLVGSQTSPNTNITISKLFSDTFYNFSITSVNSVGSSIQSNVVTVLTNTVPDPPTILTVTAGDSEITISWVPENNGGSQIKRYIVTPYSVITLSQNSPPILTKQPSLTVTNTTTATFTGLINGLLYTFTVIAINGVGQSDPSDYSTYIAPVYVPLPPKGDLIDYCKKKCPPVQYNKIATSGNNPNISKRMQYASRVNNKCSSKNNLSYDDLIRLYNFPPLDVSGMNQNQAIQYTAPAFLNAMF